MTSVWRSLLWKEWREQRMILLAILAIAALGPLPFAWENAGVYRAGLAMMALLFVPLASVFVGAWIAAGEQSRRTMEFLQALPVAMSTPARIKLLSASGVVLAPGIIASTIGLVWIYANAFSREDFATGLTILASITLVPLSLMLWTAAIGADARDEVRAGVLSLAGGSMIWLLFAMVALAVTPRDSENVPTWLTIAAAAAPGSPGVFISEGAGLFSRGLFFAGFASVMVLAHCGVALIYIRRFGRVARHPQMAPSINRPSESELRWLAPPRSSRWAATAWKQARETAPLAGIALAAILGIVAAFAVVANRVDPSTVRETTLSIAFGVWVTIGYAGAVVCGIGLLHDDLRPEIHTFWRSRPIRLGPWFATKLNIGLAITLTSLAAAPVIVALIVGLSSGRHVSADDVVAIAAVLAFQACGFLVAMAAAAAFRTATAAALVTLLVTLLALYSVDKFSLCDPHDPLSVLVLTAPAAAVAIAASWLVLKKDWRIG